ncbi:hypothetical protein CASFOL_028803 [Castilleja foliolosa]|uniref:Bifunctional inhibitor/plant lipid transfer protein/seed storage helical domain-containing protein n=1 Tax=Castilleja foliolosa TaxID=1961234 RepID=A0ABD3CC65_9LAMI
MCRKMEYSSILIVGLLVLAVGPMSRVSAISCIDTITMLMPCQPFLMGNGNDVTVPCCQGAESLSQLVSSNRNELKDTCQCIKQAAAAMGVDVARAKQIPQLCNISVPVPIDPNVNCDICDALEVIKGGNEVNQQYRAV